MAVATPPVRRELTAMRRFRCSRPMAFALADGVVSRDTTVFDYGCGHGADLQHLKRSRIKASGWDPAHRRDGKVVAADVVNLGYVLNVIEDPVERARTLTKAFSLARHALVVSVRVDNAIEDATEFGDGVLTGKQTFQKIYTQPEFRHYIETTLSRPAHSVALGIAYVFVDVDAEARYLANRSFTRRLEYRTDLIEEFSKNRTAKRFVALANELGRVPLPAEFTHYSKLLEAFGSAQRVERLTLRHIDRNRFEGSRTQRRDDILTFFAVLRLRGMRPPPFSQLPASVQSDVKVIWRSHSAAVEEGDRFLFSLGSPEAVRAACQESRVGKLLPEDLYVHKSAEEDLPPLLRVIVFAASQVVGDVGYDVVKISCHGRSVSFLSYPTFDTDGHPALARSVRVFLPKADYTIRDYSKSENPPILHRKETFVRPDYATFDAFAKLTSEEEKAGLLSNSEIGFQRSWRALLDSRGLSVVGHDLQEHRSNSRNDT